MRKANPELEKHIRQVALELLMTKEPAEIGMRDIASACGVSPTTLYYYYADKDALFERVKLDCLADLDAYIEAGTAGAVSSSDKMRAGMKAFRDWSFANPRVALLVMDRFKRNVTAAPGEMEGYYRSFSLAERLLASDPGLSRGKDVKLEVNLAIAMLWGGISSILLTMTSPEFWDRGEYFTDCLIDRIMTPFLNGGKR